MQCMEIDMAGKRQTFTSVKNRLLEIDRKRLFVDIKESSLHSKTQDLGGIVIHFSLSALISCFVVDASTAIMSSPPNQSSSNCFVGAETSNDNNMRPRNSSFGSTSNEPIDLLSSSSDESDDNNAVHAVSNNSDSDSDIEVLHVKPAPRRTLSTPTGAPAATFRPRSQSAITTGSHTTSPMAMKNSRLNARASLPPTVARRSSGNNAAAALRKTASLPPRARYFQEIIELFSDEDENESETTHATARDEDTSSPSDEDEDNNNNNNNRDTGSVGGAKSSSKKQSYCGIEFDSDDEQMATLVALNRQKDLEHEMQQKQQQAHNMTRSDIRLLRRQMSPNRNKSHRTSEQGKETISFASKSLPISPLRRSSVPTRVPLRAAPKQGRSARVFQLNPMPPTYSIPGAREGHANKNRVDSGATRQRENEPFGASKNQEQPSPPRSMAKTATRTTQPATIVRKRTIHHQPPSNKPYLPPQVGRGAKTYPRNDSNGRVETVSLKRRQAGSLLRPVPNAETQRKRLCGTTQVQVTMPGKPSSASRSTVLSKNGIDRDLHGAYTPSKGSPSLQNMSTTVQQSSAKVGEMKQVSSIVSPLQEEQSALEEQQKDSLNLEKQQKDSLNTAPVNVSIDSCAASPPERLPLNEQVSQKTHSSPATLSVETKKASIVRNIDYAVADRAEGLVGLSLEDSSEADRYPSPSGKRFVFDDDSVESDTKSVSSDSDKEDETYTEVVKDQKTPVQPGPERARLLSKYDAIFSPNPHRPVKRVKIRDLGVKDDLDYEVISTVHHLTKEYMDERGLPVKEMFVHGINDGTFFFLLAVVLLCVVYPF